MSRSPKYAGGNPSRPLQDNLSAFRMRHRDEPDAQELADRCQQEIDIWHAYSEFYGYEFLVLRAR